jgi:cyclic beta-1,2-glucan synthetase
VIDRPGGIFVRPADQISDEDRILFQTVARAIISDSRGTLAEQLNRRGPWSGACRACRLDPDPYPPFREPPGVVAPRASRSAFRQRMGGFTPDGREYVITTAPGRRHRRRG